MSAPHEAPHVKPRKTPKKPHGLSGGSSEANRFAVVILEVLAGGRTPTDAAKTLGVTLPRYYQLEVRALAGLVAALEPRPKVRQPSLQGRIAQLEKALAEARRECLRQQALVRAAQRNLGIKPPSLAENKPAEKDGAGRKKRRPTVRALKAARLLAHNSTRPSEPETLQLAEDSLVRPAVLAAEGDGALPGGIDTVFQGTIP
jgi:hypothetical protein